jgi:acetyl-CoA C-acetyltransferase
MEHFEGIFFTEMWSVDAAVPSETRDEVTTGTTGKLWRRPAITMWLRAVRTVMTIGWEKQSEGETTAGLIFQADPLWERATMSGAIGSFAGSATAYMHKYGITEEQAAKVAVKNRRNAIHNPHAHLKMDLTVEQVLNSKMLAYPIKMLDMCPTSDGACAMIFASEQKAKRICPTRPGCRGHAARPAFRRGPGNGDEPADAPFGHGGGLLIAGIETR